MNLKEATKGKHGLDQARTVKKHRKNTGDPKSKRDGALVSVPQTLPQKAPEDWWTPEKEKALTLLFQGTAKAKAARDLGVTRQTIIAWSQHPEFRDKYSELLGSHVESARQRHVLMETRFADKTAKILNRNLDAILAGNNEPSMRVSAQIWAEEFRAWRGEEREDFGDKISRSEISMKGQINVDNRTSHEISFRDFLSARIDSGVVDVEAMSQNEQAGNLVAAAVSQILADDLEIVDILNREDQAMMIEKKR